MKMCEQVSGAMNTPSGSDDSVNHQLYGGDVVTCGNDVMRLQEDSTGDRMMNQQLQSSGREARGEHGAPYMVGYNPNAERQIVEKQTAERQTAERQTAERQTAERQTAERQTAERQTAERQTAERQRGRRQRGRRQRQTTERQMTGR